MRSRSTKTSHLKPGFMFIELLIVLGMMGIMSAIVLVAINPKKNLCEVANGKRHITEREITNAVNEYEIHTFKKAVEDLSIGEKNAKAICRQGVTNASCVNVDLLVPDYLTSIPQDSSETGGILSGYGLYRYASGTDQAIAMRIETCK